MFVSSCWRRAHIWIAIGAVVVVSARSAGAAGRSPPIDPDADGQAAECLNADGARSAEGRVHNRFLWCQHWFVSGGLGTIGIGGGTTNAATFELEYSAVGYGRDDGSRSVKIFFRGENLVVTPLKGSLRPQSLFSQRIVCDDASCLGDPAPIVKPFTAWLHQWTQFTLVSDATGFNAPDKILYHQWHFAGSARSVLEDKSTPEGVGASHTIRCDSAPYFRGRSAACIFDDVIPHLQYSKAVGSQVRGVALHIECAQNSLTCQTWPEANLKLIPGTFVPGVRGPGLHRIPGEKTAPPDNQRAKDNRAESSRACDRVGRYRLAPVGEFPGLPATLIDRTFQDCDEYPFASTAEGAAANGSSTNAVGTPQFSVLGVDSTENQCGGRDLARYYRDDRILYYDRDTFYVQIKPAAGNNGADECPVLLDGDDDAVGGFGGGMPVLGDPINLDAGPDVSGLEGGSVLLAARATGALSLQWTYTAGPDVAAGATCSFTSPQLASTRITCSDNGTYTATVTATNGSQQVSDSVVVHIANEPPKLKIVAPVDWQVFRVGTPVALSAPFTDAGANDSHTCLVTWDDGSVENYPATGKTCDRTRAFSRAGMFSINLTVRDDDGGTDTQPVMVVVYDPDGGFVTAGGYFASPAGALADNPQASGRAHFEFNPKYKKGDTGPAPSNGKVSFRLDFASFDLDAQTLEWLVVTPDGKAAVKGTATINGTPGFGFVLYAYDRDQAPGDAFRMVAWPLSQGNVPPATARYDSSGNASYDLDLAEPLPLTGGSIQVHK